MPPMQGQLRWAASVIPTSLLDYANKDLAKYATRIHRNILGYTVSQQWLY